MLFWGFVFAEWTIQDVSLKFCNDGLDKLAKDYVIKLDQGKKQDLCIYIENKSDKPVHIKYSFPNGLLNPQGNQVCDNWDDFTQFFVHNPKREAYLSWNSSLILKETIVAPVGLLGMQYGCLAYQATQPEVTWMWGVFNMEVRKVAHINLFVGSEAFIENKVDFIPGKSSLFSSNKNIVANLTDEGDLILNFSLQNNWNMDQDIVLEWKLYNPLGFERIFTLSWGKLGIGEIYEWSVNLWVIPFYKWLFSVRATLTATPSLGFADALLDARYKEPLVIKETGTLFIFSLSHVVVVVVVLLLIIAILVPKKKKPEVEIQLQ
jgi:hypothetical protein